MNIFSLLIRELKDWVEFFIMNTPGRTGYFFRSNYYKIRLKKTFKDNRFESGLRIEFPKTLS